MSLEWNISGKAHNAAYQLSQCLCPRKLYYIRRQPEGAIREAREFLSFSFFFLFLFPTQPTRYWKRSYIRQISATLADNQPRKNEKNICQRREGSSFHIRLPFISKDSSRIFINEITCKPGPNYSLGPFLSSFESSNNDMDT